MATIRRIAQFPTTQALEGLREGGMGVSAEDLLRHPNLHNTGERWAAERQSTTPQREEGSRQARKRARREREDAQRVALGMAPIA